MAEIPDLGERFSHFGQFIYQHFSNCNYIPHLFPDQPRERFFRKACVLTIFLSV